MISLFMVNLLLLLYYKNELWKGGMGIEFDYMLFFLEGFKVAWLYAMQKDFGSQDDINENVCTKWIFLIYSSKVVSFFLSAWAPFTRNYWTVVSNKNSMLPQAFC